MMRRPLIVLMVVLSAGSAAPRAQQAQRAPQNDSILQNDLRADLFFLAGDGFRGRLTGSPENALAAEFVKSRFERMGLDPIGPDKTFFHPFNLMTATLGERNALTIRGASAATLELEPFRDYFPQRFSATGLARGKVAFAGFGIVDAKLGHDDYPKVDGTNPYAGRVVVVLDHEPGENDPTSPFDGVVTSQDSTNLYKALYAQEKGAAGILFVSDVHNHPGAANFEAVARAFWPPKPPRIESYTLEAWMQKVRIPAAQISPALATMLLGGASLDDLGRLAEARGGLKSPVLSEVDVEIRADVARHVFSDRSVVGAIRGSDPALRDEWVIVSAHFDHEGAEDTRIWNGADDNGSGTVALIEIAEAYALAAKAGARPKRSVLFADWDSEERGLLGAWAFTEHPLFPLDKVVAVLNMDMIGRNEEVQPGGGARFRGLEIQTAESNANAANVIGSSYSKDLANTITVSNEIYNLTLRLRYDNNPSNLLRRSDNWPFLQRGVPSIFFHTGLHPDYHTIYDRPEKINYEKMEKIARLIHQTSWVLATQTARPRFDGRKNPPPSAQ
ncbi:MAG: M28 family peptidase [Vicinamibacterales bacterium]